MSLETESRFNTKYNLYLVIMACLFFFFTTPCVLAQPVNFTLDFETGDLRGWEKTGDTFNYQPTLGDNPIAGNRGQPSNHQGRYWIGTYEKYQGHPHQRQGTPQGNKPLGKLTSSSFIIPDGTLSFLIGGGSSSQTRIELLIIEKDTIEGVDIEKAVKSATGRNTETMHRETWDLTPYTGKTGRIRIADESSQEWGHINADDFKFAPAAIDRGPVLHLRIESSPPFQAGRPVRFSVGTEAERPGLKYQFHFGDGSVSNWMSEKSAEHVYTRDETYSAFVTAAVPTKSSVLTRARSVVRVNSNTVLVNIRTQPLHIDLYLRADREHIRTGQSITFSVNMEPGQPDTAYRFDFGDGKSSEWTNESMIEHVYSLPGIYEASVKAGKNERIIADSSAVRIEVRDSNAISDNYNVFLETKPDHTGPDKNIVFTARLEPYAGGTEYRFVFGDGGIRDWSNEALAEHSYQEPGEYNAFVSARNDQEIIRTSPSVMLTINRPLAKIPWILIIAVSFSILLGGYYLFSGTNKHKKTITDAAHGIQIRSYKDFGTQEIESESFVQSGVEIHLKPVSDKGVQKIEPDGPIIIEERREHE